MEPIVIRHLAGSSLAGAESRHDTDVVRLGRLAANDVVFDPLQDRLVSGRHAEILRTGSVLVVHDLGSRNGTYVNGRRVSAPAPIGPDDVVCLGARGPRFSVRRAGEGAAAAVDGAPRDAVPAAGIGMNTLMGALSQVTRRERRRAVRLLGAVVALSTVASAALWSRIETGTERVAVVQDFTDVLARVEPAVYVVLLRDESGDVPIERGFGTAWSVAPGRLATNAHVAREFQGIGRDQVLVARSSSDPPHDLRITGIDVHPGYDEFQELLARYRPYHHTEGSFLTVAPACDVALLHVAAADVPRQSPSIPLADQVALQSLGNGAPCAYVGFPAEGISAGGTQIDRPTATAVTGTLSKQTDVFLGRAERPEEAIALTYYLQTAGGGSGSPVVDAQGRAIGLVAAINVAGVGLNGSKVARIAAGGTSYGPRVDVLRELLEGTAAAAQTVRRARWEVRLLELFRLGIGNPKGLALAVAHDELPAAAQQAGVAYRTLEATELHRGALRGAGPGAAVDCPVRIPTTGILLIIAVALDRPVRLGSTARFGHQTPTCYEPTSYFTGTVLRMVTPDTLHMQVYADPAETEPATRFAIYLVRAVP